jgi:hypothetical protein
VKTPGPEGVVNVNLTYAIKDPNGNIVDEKKATVGIETIRKDIYYLTIPEDSPPGIYSFECLVQYKNYTVFSYENFQVIPRNPLIPISVKKIDIPLIVAYEKNEIGVTLENSADYPLEIAVTMDLPGDFEPSSISKNIMLNPFSEETIEFNFIPQEPKTFTGFISIRYDNEEITKEFYTKVYSPQTLFILVIRKYWWWVVNSLIIIALILLIITLRLYQKEYEKRK